MDRVILFREKGQWRWRRLAENNRIVAAASEGYLHRKDALENLHRVNGSEDEYVLEEPLEA